MKPAVEGKRKYYSEGNESVLTGHKVKMYLILLCFN